MPQAAPMPMPTLSKHNHEDDATLPLSPATDTLPGAGSETQDMRVLAESSPVGQCASASNHTSTAAIGGKRHIVEADIDEGLPAVDLSTLDGTSVSPVVSPPLLASTQRESISFSTHLVMLSRSLSCAS